MSKKFMTPKFTLRLALCLVVLTGITSAVAFSSPQSGGTIAGDYIWLETTRAQLDARQEYCNNNFGGDPCVELCMTSGGGAANALGMDRYCCLDPSLLGGWDNPQECTAWIP